MPSSTITLILVILLPLLFATLGVLRATRTRVTMEDYLTARNSVGVKTGTATLVATALGAWILFSPAETSTFAGLPGLLGYALGSAAPLVAFIFIGVRLRRLMPDGHSLNEYVWHRFGRWMYIFILIVMVFYMFVFLTAELTGIALVVHFVAGTPLVVTAMVIGGATLAYTAYGGLRATIFTDTMQFVVIIPLLLLAFAGVIVGLGGADAVIEKVGKEAPELLKLDNMTGWQTGIALAIAILAANLFHQGYWQRVYASKTPNSLKISFGISAFLIIPIVMIVGLFGIIGMGVGVVDHPSVALFTVLEEAVPSWIILLVVLLAVALVMSSMDSLLSALVSMFTIDMNRIRPNLETRKLLAWARLATVVLVLIAVAIATQGYSVLYMFLIADLVAAAVVVPVFLGLYMAQYQGWMAIASGLTGLIIGSLFFPDPDFAAWVNIPWAGNLMASFLVALVASSSIALILAKVAHLCGSGAIYDFQRLRQSVRSFSPED